MAATDDLDPWEQALVDHGYLVASVDYRGSTGSTVAWRTALHGGNIGLPEVADVVAALDHLVAAGLTDPARVAVEGWSWGGYVSLLAAGLHPDRFAAVVGGVPVGDLVLCHEDCSPPQQAYDLAILGGGPDELPELYAERSPITYVDRVRAPVLLIAGEHDSACPIRQVRHYADRLRAVGGDVRLHVYDAGHHANAVDERLRARRARAGVPGRAPRAGRRHTRDVISRDWAPTPTGPARSDSTDVASPTPPREIAVAASRQTHSPSGSRCRCTVSSGLMNSQRRRSSSPDTPLPLSATAITRCRPVGSSPSTSG